MNREKIERDAYDLAQTMTMYGVTLEEAIEELKIAYAEQLEEMARHAREHKQ